MKQFAVFDDNGFLLQIITGYESNIPSDILSENVLEITQPIPIQPESDGVWRFSKKLLEWVNVETEEDRLEKQWEKVRLHRDQMLLSSDWTQLPDVPLATKEAWAVYRQALRDITLQKDPFNIVWPTPPT